MHFIDFWPLGMCIDCQEVHFSTEGSSEVNMHSLPWSSRPDPGVEWGYCRRLFDRLAGYVGLDQMLNVFVKTRPPDIAPSLCFHPRDSRVITMELLENAGLQLLGDKHTNSPQETLTLHRQFMTSGAKWLQSFRHLIRPSSLSIQEHLA